MLLRTAPHAPRAPASSGQIKSSVWTPPNSSGSRTLRTYGRRLTALGRGGRSRGGGYFPAVELLSKSPVTAREANRWRWETHSKTPVNQPLTQIPDYTGLYSGLVRSRNWSTVCRGAKRSANVQPRHMGEFPNRHSLREGTRQFRKMYFRPSRHPVCVLKRSKGTFNHW